jgi:hypothetical protein
MFNIIILKYKIIINKINQLIGILSPSILLEQQISSKGILS